MKYKLLGNSGLRVSELCLGTMTFGNDWGWGSSEDESRAVFDVFAEQGGNFIDTANFYTKGTSEKYVGAFVKSERDKWVVATKYALNTSENGEVNSFGNHRKNMVQAVEASLKRLQTGYLDLLWLHAWDFKLIGKINLAPQVHTPFSIFNSPFYILRQEERLNPSA